ncbi:MAG: F0F1 ATP synthase subunit delta [Alphaproteobacteria bacterium]
MTAQSGPVSGIAGRYANALFDLADERKVLDDVAEDLRSTKRMLDESADLRKLVRSPVIKSDDQARALGAVLERAGVSQLTRNFVGVVARNRRLFALEAMIAGYLAILARRRGEVTAEVTAAKPLSDTQMASLQDSLRQVVGGKVSVDLTVDPAVLGGLVVKVGSRLFDSSIRTKLQRMQQAMRGA